ncbi:MAG TPA: hypothetical protein VHN74_09780 [Candidatus Angelobacter sp.]|jgi:hypothetical protein|nr:hypothetical protein [Candidatus Angelobacter sp.]
MTICSKKTARAHEIIAASVALILILGCNSASSKPVNGKSGAAQKGGVATNAAGPDIDLNCITRHIQSPTESFHYSFSDASENSWQEDAEITPQNIDGSFMNSFLPAKQEFHGPPQQVSSNLMAIGRMASIFSTVHMTGAVMKQGAEKKNGYETVKFSIDTAQGSSVEQNLFKTIFGPGGFERGSVWVTQEGCPVQITLDEELHARDGSPNGKAHYEEAMVRKP